MSPLGGIGFLAVPPNLLSWVRGSGGSIILGERDVHDDLGEGLVEIGGWEKGET